MKEEMFEFAGCKGLRLPGVIWQPEGEVRAVLQITHGLTEHMGRYRRLAAHLSARGVAVAGFDLRGHGKNDGDASIASCGEGGWEATIEDMYLFFRLVKQRFPETPYYMLGFSLGSFLLREYLTQYSDGIAGAIIAGTGQEPGWLLSLMRGIVKDEIQKAGFDGVTKRVRNITFGIYNRDFRPNRTEADWLCADEEELDQYFADPLVRKDVSSGLFYELFGSMKRTGKAFDYGTLPVLLLSGEDDSVGGFGRTVKKVYKHMKKTGMDHVSLRLFEEARHDIFHEEANGVAEKVRCCICEWILKDGL